MNKTGKVIFSISSLILIGCLMFLYIFPPQINTKIEGNREMYWTLQELEERSDLIIIGKTKQMYQMRENTEHNTTKTIVQVKEVIKTNKKEIKEKIKINENFHSKLLYLAITEENPPIITGDDYLMFLVKNNENGEYYFLSGGMGKYNLEKEEKVKLTKYNLVKEEVIKKYKK